jgi:hypothetical protein
VKMPVSLDFATSHNYAEATDGINVPITLCMARQSVELLAKLDTGAAHCIFERKYAEILGLEVESGRLQRFRTVAGSFVAYQHEVTIQTLGIEFPAAVFFAHDPAAPRCVHDGDLSTTIRDSIPPEPPHTAPPTPR